MSEKIRIKIGSMELEWESDGTLSLDNVKALLREVGTLSPPAETLSTSQAETSHRQKAAGNKSGESEKLFVTSIAAKIGAKTGADLARAAAAHLQLTEGKERFSRHDLLETMKKAPAYFKTSMRKNLSRIIDSLIPDSFNQVGGDSYSLTASELTALETVLA